VITASDISRIPLFASLDAKQAAAIAQRAAHLRLQPGEIVVNEGDPPAFYGLLAGQVELTKIVEGEQRHMAMRRPGDFFGEIPVLLQTTFFVTAKAIDEARLFRIEATDFARAVRDNEGVRELSFKTIRERIEGVAEETVETTPSMPIVIGSPADLECFKIREFLSQNRKAFEWIDLDSEGAQALIPEEARGIERFPIVVLKKPGDSERSALVAPNLRLLAEGLGLQTMPARASYDVAIVGGGPAGLAAAVYGASEGLSTLLIECAVPGGQAGSSSRIENYLGFPNGLSGDELAQRALEQAQRFGAEVVVTRSVNEIVPDGTAHRVKLEGGEEVVVRSIILSTGVSYRRLDLDDCDAKVGAGVYYGAARTEAMQTRGQDVYLVGGGNSAGQAAMYFSNYARSVTILVRKPDLAATMSQYLIDEIATRENIDVRGNAEVSAVHGNGPLEAITIRDLVTGEESRRETRGLFIFIGAEAKTDWLPPEIERDKAGFVLTGADVSARAPGGRYLLETSVPGIFAAGDVRHGSIKRVAAGVGEGSMSIAFIHQYLGEAQADRRSASRTSGSTAT
jgi:thioredoxin reductase (NADPH)